jgi:AcrR family transcriptional regulator|tara:strand:+ start:75 stop:731 length:657 start_codon:yes stop_codon:yes gene_type:complete
MQALTREENSSITPQTTKGQRTRKNILNCARKVFARAGYVTLRMSDVAEESGVSMGSLYRYFQNKDDLFVNLIGDIHEQMFSASRASEHDFAADPYQALLAANRGYLKHYHENRDVMRALIEAGTVDERFRDVWWQMRRRHIDRFVYALKTSHGIETVSGVSVRTVVESMASLVEQSAYTWFAQEELNDKPISVETAAQVVTRVWYRTFFEKELPDVG